MGLTEIAELLGMTRQGADKLVRREVAFPQPVAVLTGTRVWETAAIEKWARETGRIK
jgi:predicted DNA-binding transcriptional regulator AlpA